MPYQTEFPDFPEADMPAIPEGFVDTSWGNDMCPSFTNEALRLWMWIDYADPAAREFPETERFGLKRTDAEGCLLPDQGPEQCLIASNDWNEILAAILGEAFAVECLDSFTAAQMAQIRARNAEGRPDDDCCATHDFADANMIMLEAFKAAFGREPQFLDGTDEAGNHSAEGEADIALWNAAWTWAKARHLTEGKVAAPAP